MQTMSIHKHKNGGKAKVAKFWLISPNKRSNWEAAQYYSHDNNVQRSDQWRFWAHHYYFLTKYTSIVGIPVWAWHLLYIVLSIPSSSSSSSSSRAGPDTLASYSYIYTFSIRPREGYYNSFLFSSLETIHWLHLQTRAVHGDQGKGEPLMNKLNLHNNYYKCTRKCLIPMPSESVRLKFKRATSIWTNITSHTALAHMLWCVPGDCMELWLQYL